MYTFEIVLVILVISLIGATWLITYNVMKERIKDALEKARTDFYGRWVMEIEQLENGIRYSVLEIFGNPIRRRMFVAWRVGNERTGLQEHALVFLDESEEALIMNAKNSKRDLMPVHFEKVGSTIKIVD